ncbi:MAG: hypothetical protein ACE5JN_06815 [Candidatus Methylomirabilia bacterium]
MFDRTFFERQFSDQVQLFCREQKIAAPVVELLLDDGSVLRLQAIAQIRENWLALKARLGDAESRMILCPYFSIRRITFSRPSSEKETVFSFPPKP